ncbi:MAG: CPBP family intramembrane glutamic endopeptidase [Pseudomonadota bacterium]
MSAFENYLAPARKRAGFWRVILGIILIMTCWIIGMILLLMGWVISRIVSGQSVDAAVDTLDVLKQGGDPLGILVLLMSFAGIWVGIFTAMTWLHRQGFFTIFAPRASGALRDFFKGVLLALAMVVPGALIAVQMTEPFPGLPLDQWLMWVVPVLLMVGVQATGEELIFRGYLLQQLAIRSHSWLVWAALPSVLFGLLHYGARTDGGDLYYIAVTTVMGLTFCTLVWRSGSLMPAIGLHVTVNAAALTAIGPEGTLGGTQLWLLPEDAFLPLIQMDLGISVLVLILVVSPLGRVFNRMPEAATG